MRRWSFSIPLVTATPLNVDDNGGTTIDLRPLIDVAHVFTLVWYGATNYAASRLRERQRFAPRGVSWLGILGCLVLLFTLPAWALLLAAGIIALSMLGRSVVRSG
jgi:APA family basic amino acid/polyamine antiporter